jgi:hypothetical protein
MGENSSALPCDSTRQRRRLTQSEPASPALCRLTPFHAQYLLRVALQSDTGAFAAHQPAFNKGEWMGCIGMGLQRIDQRSDWQWRYKYRYLVRKKEGLPGKEREGSKKEGTERGVCVESEGVSIASMAPASLRCLPVLPEGACTALEGAVPLHNVPLAPLVHPHLRLFLQFGSGWMDATPPPLPRPLPTRASIHCPAPPPHIRQPQPTSTLIKVPSLPRQGMAPCLGGRPAA